MGFNEIHGYMMEMANLLSQWTAAVFPDCSSGSNSCLIPWELTTL
jgi:hypothetical protein